MLKRGRLRVSSLVTNIKSNIIISLKGDLPTYIANDIIRQLGKGETYIVISMCKQEGAYKSLPEYLNEYHSKNEVWKLDFLNIAYEFTYERVKQKLKRYKKLFEFDSVELSDTDKRIIIKKREKKKKSLFKKSS